MKNLFGSRLLNIGASTLLSGGILSHGGLGGYISDAARRVIGLGLAEFQDGAVPVSYTHLTLPTNREV